MTCVERGVRRIHGFAYPQAVVPTPPELSIDLLVEFCAQYSLSLLALSVTGFNDTYFALGLQTWSVLKVPAGLLTVWVAHSVDYASIVLAQGDQHWQFWPAIGVCCLSGNSFGLLAFQCSLFLTLPQSSNPSLLFFFLWYSSSCEGLVHDCI